MKLIIKWDEKCWLKALGLHHASIVFLAILVGYCLNIAPYVAMFCVGWYGSKEWGCGRIAPPKVFEILDFISPVIVVGFYFYLQYKEYIS